jgi:hypothetical protein
MGAYAANDPRLNPQDPNYVGQFDEQTGAAIPGTAKGTSATGTFKGDTIDMGSPGAGIMSGVLGNAVAPAAVMPASGTPIGGGGAPGGVVFGSYPAGATVHGPLQAGATPLAAQTPGTNQSTINNLLANILGPNYQSLLSTGDRSGQVGGGMADPATIMAQAYASQEYARRNLMENAAMQSGAANWNARWNSQNPVANPTGGAFGSAVNPDWASASAYQRVLNQSAAQANRTAQAAALSPAYPPQIQSSVGQQNTNAMWNPNTTSGWVSPAASYGASYGGAGRPSTMLMQGGI